MTACSCCPLCSGGTIAAAAASSAALSAGLDATLAVAKAVGKVSPLVPGRYSHGWSGRADRVLGGVLKALGTVCPKISVAHAQNAPLPQTYSRCCGQNVPYVKCMVNGLVALTGACDQAVHNKERCLSLSAYAAPSRRRASAVRLHPLHNAANAAGSKGCAPCSTESSICTSSEVRSAFDPA